jgi:hypothetical protein
VQPSSYYRLLKKFDWLIAGQRCFAKAPFKIFMCMNCKKPYMKCGSVTKEKCFYTIKNKAITE